MINKRDPSHMTKCRPATTPATAAEINSRYDNLGYISSTLLSFSTAYACRFPPTSSFQSTTCMLIFFTCLYRLLPCVIRRTNSQSPTTDTRQPQNDEQTTKPCKSRRKKPLLLVLTMSYLHLYFGHFHLFFWLVNCKASKINVS